MIDAKQRNVALLVAASADRSGPSWLHIRRGSTPTAWRFSCSRQRCWSRRSARSGCTSERAMHYARPRSGQKL